MKHFTMVHSKRNSTHLISLGQHGDQVLGLLSVVLGEERVRRSLGTGPARTTDSVDVVLGVLWVIKVDYKVDAVHVFTGEEKRKTVREGPTKWHL